MDITNNQRQLFGVVQGVRRVSPAPAPAVAPAVPGVP